MKKISILLLCIFTYNFLFAQKDGNTDFPINEVLTLKKLNGFKVIASDVYTNSYSFKRKIELFKNEKSQPETIYLSFTSDDKSVNIYPLIKDAPEKISGKLIFEYENTIILTKVFVNGLVQNQEIDASLSKTKPPFYNPNVPCTVTTIHNCVSYNIDEMSWISYLFCMVGAPACYAEQWANCSWQVCHNHMQYTNPY